MLMLINYLKTFLSKIYLQMYCLFLFIELIALQLLIDNIGTYDLPNNNSKYSEVCWVRIYKRLVNYNNPCFNKLQFLVRLFCCF
jgi:hypothetical protein